MRFLGCWSKRAISTRFFIGGSEWRSTLTRKTDLEYFDEGFKDRGVEDFITPISLLLFITALKARFKGAFTSPYP